MTKSMYPSLTAKDAFLHVIYEFRYLAEAGKSWNIQKTVQAQDSIHLHSRAIIEFFIGSKKNRDKSDVVVQDFGFINIVAKRQLNALIKYKASLEVHSLHITAWRDTNYRKIYGSTEHGKNRARQKWNMKNYEIVELLLELCRKCSVKNSAIYPWAIPFKELYEATSNLYSGKTKKWPKQLTEKNDVNKFLEGLNIK